MKRIQKPVVVLLAVSMLLGSLSQAHPAFAAEETAGGEVIETESSPEETAAEYQGAELIYLNIPFVIRGKLHHATIPSEDILKLEDMAEKRRLLPMMLDLDETTLHMFGAEDATNDELIDFINGLQDYFDDLGVIEIFTSIVRMEDAGEVETDFLKDELLMLEAFNEDEEQ